MERSFRRARSEEEKGARRAHLLATARSALADGADLRELGLNELARRAGMAKANVYRYFESREALFLALLQEEWGRVDAALRAELGAVDRLGSGALGGLLAAHLAAAPMLCALIAALPTTLEQNLSPETVARFKRETLAGFRSTGEAMHAACPAIRSDRCARLLHDGCAAVVGLHPFAHPAPAVAEALREPDLAPMRRDFAADLDRMLRALACQAEAEGP